MGSRKHRWKGQWHSSGCSMLALSHWHVRCRDKGCELWWMQPVLFDPAPFET